MILPKESAIFSSCRFNFLLRFLSRIRVNINNCGVCFIDPEDPETAISQSMVEQCDVTTDVPYEGNIIEIKKSLIIKNNNEYTITTSTSNRFSIENTAVTKRKRERLIVYDKGDEMARSSNRPFLGHINNPNEQIEYFKDKMRLELNLKSVDRMRKYLNVQIPQLHSILNSTVDPIGEFLHNALSPDSTLALLKHKTPKLRNLEHLQLMCLCDFDMAYLERVIRDTTGKNNSITNSLAPYKLLYEQVERNAPAGHNEAYFIKLRDLLRESVTIAFSSSDYSSRNNLHYLYFSNKHDSDETYTIENQDDTSILNISMPQLPCLPES